MTADMPGFEGTQSALDALTRDRNIDPQFRAALLTDRLVAQAIAAEPRYDNATLDAAIHAVRDLILASKFRETAATLNRAIAAIEKLRA